MPFFEGASNVTIRGGKFNAIEGDYTVIKHSLHETNIDSNNTYDNKVTGSYNNNSKRFSEQFH